MSDFQHGGTGPVGGQPQFGQQQPPYPQHQQQQGYPPQQPGYPPQQQGYPPQQPQYGGPGGPGGPGVPNGGYAPQPEPSKQSRKALIAVAITVVIALIGAGAYFLGKGDSAVGEVYLEPASFIGQDPFSPEPLADAPPAELASATVPALPAAETEIKTTTVSGGQSGLYGGSLNNASCDPQKLVAFLGANADKAQAFVDALNADPNLRWANGKLATADIAAYVATLTPMVLTADTRVTNHGFKTASRSR